MPHHGSIRNAVARHLREDILPFWTRNTWDAENGGFTTHLGDHGARTGCLDKYLVPQARMIRTLAAAHRHGVTDRGLLELAEQGFRFLTTRMWDERHEGFFMAVRPDGSPLHDWKWTYGHAFALYAISEFHLASGNREALAWSRRTYDLLERRAREGDDGWREFLRRDWSPRLRRRRQRTSDNHLHLMEAMMVFHEATRDERHARTLRLLTRILLERTLHPSGCVIDKFSLDWRPRRGIDLQVTTSYGHCAELAWLLCDACEQLGMPRDSYAAAVLRLVDYVLEFGWDPERGSVAFYGAPGRHVLDCRTMRPRRHLRGWWQQAEMLVALLRAYKLTRNDKYLWAFAKLFRWVWDVHIDRNGGDWHAWVSWPDGRPLPCPKGDHQKACYHNGRAMMECERALDELGLADWTGE